MDIERSVSGHAWCNFHAVIIYLVLSGDNRKGLFHSIQNKEKEEKFPQVNGIIPI
jgi:hypothetical protein